MDREEVFGRLARIFSDVCHRVLHDAHFKLADATDCAASERAKAEEQCACEFQGCTHSAARNRCKIDAMRESVG